MTNKRFAPLAVDASDVRILANTVLEDGTELFFYMPKMDASREVEQKMVVRAVTPNGDIARDSVYSLKFEESKEVA